MVRSFWSIVSPWHVSNSCSLVAADTYYLAKPTDTIFDHVEAFMVIELDCSIRVFDRVIGFIQLETVTIRKYSETDWMVYSS